MNAYIEIRAAEGGADAKDLVYVQYGAYCKLMALESL
jgi:protein subunit release factor B